MKKSLTFIFFLWLFCQCDQVDNPPMMIKPGPGQADKRTDGPPPLRAERGPGGEVLTGGPPPLRAERGPGGEVLTGGQADRRTGGRSDSLLTSRIKFLRSNGIEPDLNEPVTKDVLFSPVADNDFVSMITLSHESFLRVNFDNDILDYTDRFYTNGIRIEAISPGLQMGALSRMLIPYWGSGTNYYGLALVQNMFTPSTTKTGGILYGDRPYSAYLYAGCFKITNDPVHRFRQTSELDLGIIGPNSYGEWVQRSFHNSVPTNNEPLGWEYQIRNDLVLNYSVSFEKGIFTGKNFEMLLESTGTLGTLYTNFTGGGQIRTGWLNPWFANLGVSKKQALKDAGLRKTQFFFFIRGSGKIVGYDATLEGGLLNTTSSYTLPAAEITRIVFQGSGGITFSCNGMRLDVEQFMLSPEFQDGWWHKWVHVALTFSL